MSNLSDFFGGQPFDPKQVDTSSSSDVYPPGDLAVLIESASIKQNSKQTGHYIEITYQILDGPFKGRKYWDRLNVDNPNEKAREIAYKDLARICDACGIAAVDDTNQLVNQQLCLSLKIDTKSGDNRVRKYKSITEYAPAAAAAPATAPTPLPPAAPAVQAQPAAVAPQPQAAPAVPAAQPVAAAPAQSQTAGKPVWMK
jgi:hypothetical protein